MQAKKANELRKEWGDKPCEHPCLTKEYELGSATGDYFCATCGKSGWGRDWARSSDKGQKESDEAAERPSR